MERDIINQSAIAARGPSFCGADNQEVGQYELCRHQSMGIIIRAAVAGVAAGAAVVCVSGARAAGCIAVVDRVCYHLCAGAAGQEMLRVVLI